MRLRYRRNLESSWNLLETSLWNLIPNRNTGFLFGIFGIRIPKGLVETFSVSTEVYSITTKPWCGTTRHSDVALFHFLLASRISFDDRTTTVNAPPDSQKFGYAATIALYRFDFPNLGAFPQQEMEKERTLPVEQLGQRRKKKLIFNQVELPTLASELGNFSIKWTDESWRKPYASIFHASVFANSTHFGIIFQLGRGRVI